MKPDKLIPIHPGEILLEEFLKPMNLSPDQVAESIKIPSNSIEQIIQQKHPITADLALRLARYINMSPQFWLGLQMDYDLDIAEDTIGEQITKEILSLVTS